MCIIYDDESIQSYLFRCLRIYGINSFHSVIGHNGHWHSLPEAPTQLVPYLRMVPDLTLFKSLQREGYYNFRGISKSNPLDIVELLKNVYGGSLKLSNSKGAVQITYCPHCFKEMIEKHGHAYFRNDWKNKATCDTHQVPLLNITGVNMKESIHNINDAMNNIMQDIFSNRDSTLPSINYHSLYKDVVEPQELNFMMPCTFGAIYFFVREYYSLNYRYLKFKSYLYDRMFYDSLSPKMDGILVQLMKNVDENVIYAALDEIIDLDYNAWLSFEKYGIKYKKFSFGFNQNKSLTVTVVKSATKNCSKCYVRQGGKACVYDTMIKINHLEMNFLKWHYINPCEQRLIWGFNVF